MIPRIIRKYIKNRSNPSLQEKGISCLTFDDGPDPRTTPQILDLLSKHGIKATFFVLGKNVRKYPELFDSISEFGHEIAEHSFEHLHPGKTNPVSYFADLIKGKNTINKSVDSNIQRYFRPPYGEVNLMTFIYIIIYHRKINFCNIDSFDYLYTSSGKTISEIVLSQLGPGQIIQFHDGRFISGRELSDPKITIEALEIILNSRKVKEIKFTTLSEAFKKNNHSDSLACF